MFFCIIFQPTGCFIHVVLKSIQIHSLHNLAQLQMENPKGYHCAGDISHADIVFLLHTRVHGQKDVGSLIRLVITPN